MTLELGGKFPQIVFVSTDRDLTADAIVRSILLNVTQAGVVDRRLIADPRIVENQVARPNGECANAPLHRSPRSGNCDGSR